MRENLVELMPANRGGDLYGVIRARPMPRSRNRKIWLRQPGSLPNHLGGVFGQHGLLLLSPTIQEEILFGRIAPGDKELRRMARVAEWGKQVIPSAR